MGTKVVATLLAIAKDLLEKVEDAELKDSIEALEFLGEEANGKSKEYRDLKDVVERVEATQGIGKVPKQPKQKRLNYVGIKQIGSLWYSKKDNYSKPFATADECAEHYNTEI